MPVVNGTPAWRGPARRAIAVQSLLAFPRSSARVGRTFGGGGESVGPVAATAHGDSDRRVDAAVRVASSSRAPPAPRARADCQPAATAASRQALRIAAFSGRWWVIAVWWSPATTCTTTSGLTAVQPSAGRLSWVDSDCSSTSAPA